MKKRLTRKQAETLITIHVKAIRDIARAHDPEFDYMAICITDDYFSFYNDGWKGVHPNIDYHEEEKEND